LLGKRFFCSWSGGKDSCFALYHAMRGGGIPARLVTMMTEDGSRNRAHGLPASFLQAQADSLGIPLILRGTCWDDYEKDFLAVIRTLSRHGIDGGVFGDIDLEGHREWVERVCSSVGMQAFEPLWKRDRRGLLDEFLRAGFRATIVSVKEGVLDEGFLGKTLDADVIEALERTGTDISGEDGEYHTAVTDGPIFSKPVPLRPRGILSHGGYRFLDVSVTS
jgi:uncharacterized protein (TIGR00290 family)